MAAHGLRKSIGESFNIYLQLMYSTLTYIGLYFCPLGRRKTRKDRNGYAIRVQITQHNCSVSSYILNNMPFCTRIGQNVY